MQITGDLNDEYLIMSMISRHEIELFKKVLAILNLQMSRLRDRIFDSLS